MWVIEAMLVEPEPQQSERYVTAYTRKARTGEKWSDEEWVLSYLSALNPYRADDYDDWLAVGMALHSVDDSLLTEWDNWSRQSAKYTPGCCEKKWKSFKRSGIAIGTLGHMAKQDGWRSPFDNNSPDSRKSVTSRDKSEPKLDIVERFKADLLTLTNTDDPIVQLLKINELAATYRMPAGEIRKAIAKVETATRTPKAQFFKLDDFLSMETEGIDYLIPGLLPRGETVLCVGLPKSGKTLLTIDAAFAVATGESRFLGEQVAQGRVLLVSVDESAQSTKLKLIKRGFRASDAENIAVMTTWDVSQMGELEAKLEDFRPNLVVIDSLKRITAGREISENSAEFADIIYQLKELLGRYGASGILIHHSNKSQDAVGVGKVRGSTAIAGACWGIWQLDHIIQTTDENGKPIKGKPKFDPSDPRRIFTAICRDADSQTLTIQFNPENHSYAVASEDSEAQQERKTQEQLILELLTQHHPNGLTGREIMEQLGLGRGLYTVLDRMVGRKTVTQRQSKTDSRSMVYALPKKRDTHPPSPSLQMLTKFSESTVVEQKTNSQQIVNNESPDSQRRFDQNEAVDYSIPEQMDASGDSQQLMATGGGVCVSTDEFTEVNTPELSHDGWGEVVRTEAIAPVTTDAFKVGDPVVVHGQPGEILQINHDCPEPYQIETEEFVLWFAAADVQKLSPAATPDALALASTVQGEEQPTPVEQTASTSPDKVRATTPAAPQATGTVTSSDAVCTPKAGDRIHHPEFGAGTLDQLIGDMAFCIFDEVRDSVGYVQRNAKRSPYVCELTPLLGFDEEEF
jgi:KaiC/GvpD/RAD55 family RecA-like ATPase